MAAAQNAVRDDTPGIDGYVDDEAFPSVLDQQFTPAWIDAILAQAGRPTPRRSRGPFTYVDLGCGDGVGLALLAAAHPEARFVGVDALACHVERGRTLAADIGLTNLTFDCATFAEAGPAATGAADYVVLRGVVTWVSAAAADAALDLAARCLRPGGVLAVGYNILPGWSAAVPFQRLVYDRAVNLPGSGARRFESALAQLRAEGLVDTDVLDWVDRKRATLPPGYFPHEYLNRYWSPIWSGDLLAATARRGLGFAGNADPGRQRPEFLLRRAEREALGAIADPAAREIATDVRLNACFRTDLFVKAGGPPGAAPDRLNQVWAGHATADRASYELATPMGSIRFDNPASRAILGHLQSGPRRLDRIAGISAAGLRSALDALWLAGLVTPGEAPAVVPLADRANRLVAAATTAAPLGLWVGAHGIAGRA